MLLRAYMRIFGYSPLKIQCTAILLYTINFKNWGGGGGPLSPSFVYTLEASCIYSSNFLKPSMRICIIISDSVELKMLALVGMLASFISYLLLNSPLMETKASNYLILLQGYVLHCQSFMSLPETMMVNTIKNIQQFLSW